MAYRLFAPLSLLLCVFFTCSVGQGRQEIDLTDQVTDAPADGIGHYVYALALPEQIAPGETLEIQMDWRTVGPADGRKRYPLQVRLSGPGEQVFTVGANKSTVGEINLVNWLNYYFELSPTLPAGTYEVQVRLLDEPAGTGEPLPLGFREELARSDGYYRVAELAVVPPPNRLSF